MNFMGEKILGEFIIRNQCTHSEKSVLKVCNTTVIFYLFPSLLGIICAGFPYFLGIVRVWIFCECNRNCMTSGETYCWM